MRTNVRYCLAALTLVGVSLTGCETIPSDTRASFTGSVAQPFDLAVGLLRGSTDDAIEPGDGGKLAALAPRPKPESADALLLADVRPQIVSPASPLQCVPFARDESGIEIKGDAKNWWRLAAGRYSRSRRPEQGAVFVMRGYHTDRHGHVAVVRQILDDRTIVVDHANWGNDGRIYLSAPVRDESAKNDWSKVRVWYTPDNQWGRRIYRAKGFIHPTTAIASGSNADSGLFLSRN